MKRLKRLINCFVNSIFYLGFRNPLVISAWVKVRFGKVVHRNCDNLFDGIYTDAEMMLCRNGMPYDVVNGSVVREGKVGKWALDVWARVTDTIPENDLRITTAPM